VPHLKRKLRVCDLFCGVGGASIGVKSAGHEVVAAADIDPLACSAYGRNLGLEPVWCDLRVVDGRHLLYHFGLKRDDVDLVVGCPPCQGFSSLRKTTHPDGVDDRNDLVGTFLKRVDEIRPRAFVFENVVGMTRGVGLDYLFTLLKRVKKMGYSTNAQCAADVAGCVVDAANYGVPQHRHRVIVVGTKEAGEKPSLPPRSFFPPSIGNVGRRDWKTVRDAIGDLPPLEPGENCTSVPNHEARSHTPETLRLIRAIPKDGGSRKDLPRELWLPCHLRLRDGGAESVYGRLKWDAPSVTITCRCTTPSSGRFVHPAQDRGITVREAARLQSFPDTVVFPEAQGPAQRLVGNAVPPRLMTALVDHVARAELA